MNDFTTMQTTKIVMGAIFGIVITFALIILISQNQEILMQLKLLNTIST